MDVADILPGLRAEAETLMTDTCVVVRDGVTSDPVVIDPVTGNATAAADVTVYTGKCLLTLLGTVRSSKQTESAGDEVIGLASVLKVPALAPKLLVRDRVTFLSSQFNPNLPGLQTNVTGLLVGSHMTVQRVTVEAVID